ncbi:glycosyltransferase family 2 protein [Rufibacter sediminis]|uniref:Glycosyltransferase family 2 protein n=1 Tax=Rufibacter sediminis TaxID=2762756 RepID=A0ABR6VMI2_9BACT|nr:glycosyltransferase family 2 protein [Rufibacter sediminis]MBC3538110.1 glycosyltransferase family 2 protein [Rufibacter sediminis]
MIVSTLENTAAVVVLYHPEEEVLANLASYLPAVDILFCVDNSEVKNSRLVAQLKAFPKIVYHDNQGNKGLAAALNLGANLAQSKGYAWLLTMDQDSKAHPDMLPQMRSALSHLGAQKVGIVAPFQLDKDNQDQLPQQEIQDLNAVMTSGNLLSMEAFKSVGPFRTDFFIDYVDYEYCLRLKTHGYKILQVPQAILYHSVGNITLNYLLGVRVTASNHSPIRRYYMARNRLQVMKIYRKQFPGFVKQDTFDFLKDVVRILFFEKEKGKKLLYTAFGIRDFWHNSFGKFRP